MKSLEMYDLVRNEISQKRMIQFVEEIGRWHRYTGTIQGENCVEYLTKQLKTMGIPFLTEKYDAFASLPLEANVILSSGETLKLIGDVYSSAANDLPCEFIYDAFSERDKVSANENLERFAAFHGKMVLTYASGGDFAEKLSRAGAQGMLHISKSRGGYIHHGNIGAAWGTPSASQAQSLVSIPSAGISYEDGQMLIGRLQEGMVCGRLTIKMDTAVRTSRMPIVDIPGKSEKFVLINGHYDSWYEGITDNATSDAIMLELSHAFWKHRDHLDRSVRIAWWSGHSDARYAGSTWYCDHHWADLNENCVANINLDLTGCKNAGQIRARTTCMEGPNLTANLIREFTGDVAKPYIPMIRGGDQSFWGVHIPINVMFKYEPTDEKRISSCPSGGPWWHTDQDTLDKLDSQYLLRDALLNAKLACIILNSTTLPVEIAGFTRMIKGFFEDLSEKLAGDFCLEHTIQVIDEFYLWAERFENFVRAMKDGMGDAAIKRIAGELTRLVYTSGSPYQQDRSTPYQPFGVLADAVGMTRDNTPAKDYLFQITEFQRARNRIEGQLAELTREIRCYVKSL